MPTVKILVVHYRHKPGGYSHRLRMKIEAYLDAGWEVHYIAVEPYPYTHPNLIPHILPTPMNRFDSPAFWAWFFLTAPFYALKVGLKIHPHLLSVFSPPYAWVCRLLKRLGKIPLVVFLRTSPNEALYSYKQAGWANRLEHCLNAGGLKAANLVVANSATVLEETKNCYPFGYSKTAIIPNNLPDIPHNRAEAREKLQREFGVAEGTFIVTTSGRFHKGKNIETLIRAVSKIERESITLLLFGDGEETETLKILSHDLDMNQRVIFCGWRQDVASLLPGADLFVLPSLKEGMSNSLMEALGCGVPCLVSDIAENREVIVHPDQRFSCGDVEGLAKMIKRCQEDSEFLDEIKRHTLEDASRFDFNWKHRVIETVKPWLKKAST